MVYPTEGMSDDQIVANLMPEYVIETASISEVELIETNYNVLEDPVAIRVNYDVEMPSGSVARCDDLSYVEQILE